MRENLVIRTEIDWELLHKIMHHIMYYKLYPPGSEWIMGNGGLGKGVLGVLIIWGPGPGPGPRIPGMLDIPGITGIPGILWLEGLGLCWNIWGGLAGVCCEQ